MWIARVGSPRVAPGIVQVRILAGALALVSNPSLTSAFTYTHNYTKENEMDYPIWPYLYDPKAEQLEFNRQLFGLEMPCSGDDFTRFKAGHRA
jgi:hypothetical protein